MAKVGIIRRGIATILLLVIVLMIGQKEIDNILWKEFYTKKWGFIEYIGFIASPSLWLRFFSEKVGGLLRE